MEAADEDSIMIARDQPQIFPDNVLVKVSSKNDGTILDRTRRHRHDPVVVKRRKDFAARCGTSYEDVVYQVIVYDDHQSYDRIVEVTHLDTTKHTPDISADALFTSETGVGMFLPIADCVGTVVYDPVKRFLALAHIGRHAAIADLPAKLIDFFTDKGSNPSDLIIWMAPHVQKDSYRLEYFDLMADPKWHDFVEKRTDGIYLDMSGYSRARYKSKRVVLENIHISPVDTATSADYFSHSQGDKHGRFAVLAAMKSI